MKAAKTPLATGLLFLLLLSGCNYSENYKVYAVKYCAGWRIGAEDVITGAAPSDSVDVCNMFWLLESRAGKNILVDAGFIDSTGLNRNYVRPDSVLMRMNILPEAVSDIILTHPHQDHIGGITLFPKATIWMQKEDYDYFTGPAWLDGGYSKGFSKVDVANIQEAERQGRVKFVSGDDIEIMPGIKAYTGSKHTFQNMYLLVNYNASRNRILLASDAIWFYMNFDKMLPAGICMDPEAYTAAMKRMRTLVRKTGLIIPGHDEKVFSKFDEVKTWIVRINE